MAFRCSKSTSMRILPTPRLSPNVSQMSSRKQILQGWDTCNQQPAGYRQSIDVRWRHASRRHPPVIAGYNVDLATQGADKGCIPLRGNRNHVISAKANPFLILEIIAHPMPKGISGASVLCHIVSPAWWQRDACVVCGVVVIHHHHTWS
jgi:hypothetical protein